MSGKPVEVEGHLIATGRRFAVVVSRWNHFISDRLLEGALDTVARHGGDVGQVTVYRVPGAFELPMVAKKVAEKGGVDAVIALGVLIRGSTPHFDYIAAEATKGIAAAAMDTGVPVAFGLLTTNSIEQAIERAGTKAGNKGAEAALAAIEMADLYAKMGS
jgi:6,7-dimethyl-8-ribityllumazine synthase